MPTGEKLPWFRFYIDWLTNPKVQRVSETFQRRYVALLCLRRAGEIPGADVEDMAWHLRISVPDMVETIAVLERANLWADGDIVNWDKRNPASDSSTARVQKYRQKQETAKKRFRNGTDVDLDVEEEDLEEEGRTVAPSATDAPSSTPAAPTADPLIASNADQDRESIWQNWIADLVRNAEDDEALVRGYVAALESAVQEFYSVRGGKFTPLRRANLAKRLAKFHPDIQLFAIEIYVDLSSGLKDERYLAGIAQRLRGCSPREREAEIARHRMRMAGAGLLASVTEG
jgi:hypothetical protein